MTNDYFDEVIGHVEDIIMEEEFQNLQKNFVDEHWEKFEDTEENKFIYTELFEKYTNLIEVYFVEQLEMRMGTFDMEKFSEQLRENKDKLDGEIFELLFSMLDFLTFKEMMLDFRADKEGKYDNLRSGIVVTKIVDLDDEE